MRCTKNKLVTIVRAMLGFYGKQRLHWSMQNNDARFTPTPSTTLSASQVADRMGLTTRQLQDLRLRGIGPPIVQRGLSIHYLPADVQDIERHEAAMLIEQLLTSDRPLTLLRAMADHAGFKLSFILQQVSVPT